MIVATGSILKVTVSLFGLSRRRFALDDLLIRCASDRSYGKGDHEFDKGLVVNFVGPSEDRLTDA